MNSDDQQKRGMDRRSFLGVSGGALAAGALIGQVPGRALAQTKASPVAATTSGRVQGMSIDGVHAFKGIPYGADTGGAARFLPPRKPEPWFGVREATKLGERSPQGGQDIMFFLFPELERPEPEGEDCLRLNVWTRGVADNKRRPVMVWLHGGGFATGSGGFLAYDGANLAAKEDVVAVTVNHRLNVFGYLYLPEIGGAKYSQSSNVGMLDIVQALEWVRDNIEQFGGDPDNVTIYGQSGGGGKVSNLLAMPEAKGLFHRAIIESGSTLRSGEPDKASELAERVLSLMGVKSVDELQKLPMEQIRSTVQKSGRGGAFNALALGPVVDGHTLPSHPFDPVAPAVSADVPLLVGCNATEMNFFPGAQLDPISEDELVTRLKKSLNTDDAGANKVISAYRGHRREASPLEVLQLVNSDAFLRRRLHQQAERKVALHAAPVYVYYFKWRSPVQNGRLGSFHTLEIPFVMQNVEAMKIMVGEGGVQQTLADRMSGAWAAFARSGNPNHPGLPEWPAHELTRRATMVFDDRVQEVDDPDRAERMALAAVMSS